MIFAKGFIILLVAYLLGSVNAGVIVSKFFLKDDVRTKGSGNAGATNVARVYGIRFGIITLAGDVIKTLLSALIGCLLLGRVGITLACAACFIGHCKPVFFGFKGGKGVAVGVAVIGVLDIRVMLLVLLVFVLVFLAFRRVSAASVIAAISFPIFMFTVGNPIWYEGVLSVAAGASVCWLHRSNIKRLLNGTEPKFTFKKK